jgi:hypothetical protein
MTKSGNILNFNASARRALSYVSSSLRLLYQRYLEQQQPRYGAHKTNIKASSLPATQAWGCAQCLRVQYAERTAYITALATRADIDTGRSRYLKIFNKNLKMKKENSNNEK